MESYPSKCRPKKAVYAPNLYSEISFDRHWFHIIATLHIYMNGKPNCTGFQTLFVYTVCQTNSGEACNPIFIRCEV
jgi:hypothetical protein